MRTIGGLFGRSAWGPLWEHLDKANECLKLLKRATVSFIDNDYKELNKLAKKISKLEKEADIIKENIRARLSRSLFSSVERSDILAWLRQQDGIADNCESIVKLFSIRKTVLAKELKLPLERLMNKVISIMDDAVEAVKLFCKTIDNEPSKKELDKLHSAIAKTQKGKDEASNLQIEFLKKLFGIEMEIDPISIVFLKDATEKIARIADRIENVGDLIRHIIQR